ncbi:TPA: hypothetical protein ACG5BG_004807 [Pseudomonas aeruginosa]|uniref:hypothetical protein n=1 Tax=Pseudomonas aeruginosa TaxID=287 RepID=UPI00053EDC30|nr:hypothetical protein [Pseudomonas aeruginosa]EMC2524085.1 hypothetical protein [Pseudomonas aeruginosa]MBA5208001.1 hypothetical protein [Pseudomonas aeruginosa]MBG4574051.1 hypothetical protein [Pseudomonas aeruginosa]MBM9966483.1 hypothetical protein [Pseudomonas aeruginosa]MBN0096877.1 hypothetical protein [Pseudomonas aeruginosa]
MQKASRSEAFIQTMRVQRGIEFARIGMMVEVNGERGTIKGANGSANLDVVFANVLKMGQHKHNCHPCWRVKYFDDTGELIAHHDDEKWVLRPQAKVISHE